MIDLQPEHGGGRAPRGGVFRRGCHGKRDQRSGPHPSGRAPIRRRRTARLAGNPESPCFVRWSTRFASTRDTRSTSPTTFVATNLPGTAVSVVILRAGAAADRAGRRDPGQNTKSARLFPENHRSGDEGAGGQKSLPASEVRRFDKGRRGGVDRLDFVQKARYLGHARSRSAARAKSSLAARA